MAVLRGDSGVFAPVDDPIVEYDQDPASYRLTARPVQSVTEGMVVGGQTAHHVLKVLADGERNRDLFQAGRFHLCALAQHSVDSKRYLGHHSGPRFSRSATSSAKPSDSRVCAKGLPVLRSHPTNSK